MKKNKIDSYNVLIIQDHERPSKFDLLDADFIVIQYNNEHEIIKLVEELRSHISETIVLKPIFILSYSSIKNNYLLKLTDGVINSESQIDTIIPIVELIHNRANQLYPNDDEFVMEESQIITKTLRYMHTRNWQELSPIRNRNFKLGFTYPILSINIPKYDEYKLNGILKNAASEGIFTETFLERIYLCNYCYESFLHYREVCPKCTSSFLEEEELIHHFRCATIAPAKKFKNNQNTSLNCPKCTKELRHIGIDYDKPAMMYLCKTCSHSFQDYLVKAKCTNCENDSNVEYLVGENISSYKLTNKGEHIAKKGLKIEYSQEINWDVINIESTNKFKEKYQELLIKLELGKISKFEVGVIYIIGFDEIKKITGKDYFNQLSNEIFSLITLSLDTSKTSIYSNENSLFFISESFTYEELNQKINNLILLIEKLMNNNTNLSEKLDLEYTLIDIIEPVPVNQIFEQLTNS